MPAGQPSARCAVTTIMLLLQLIPPSPLEGLGYLPSQAIYPVGMEQHALVSGEPAYSGHLQPCQVRPREAFCRTQRRPRPKLTALSLISGGQKGEGAGGHTDDINPHWTPSLECFPRAWTFSRSCCPSGLRAPARLCAMTLVKWC